MPDSTASHVEERRPILVTGGAGYIGSHVVKLLGERGERVVVLDDLSSGNAEAVLHGELVVGGTGDRALVTDLLRAHGIDSVMHFAAHTVVPESVGDPLKYYRNNTASTLALLEACADAGVDKLIFSSTAATYGIPADAARPTDEDTPTAPINPYGQSKLMSEGMIRDLSTAGALRHVILRYFNVAGSDPDGLIGQSSRDATLLIKVAAEVALGRRERLVVYGTDFPTPDGTGVRDYIHVTDLAHAHLAALDHLRGGGESALLNCGYGRGYSVREVIDAVSRAIGRPLPAVEEARRPGDPPALVAAVGRIGETLGWRPRHDDLDFIVRTSLEWERTLLERDAKGERAA